MSTPMEKQEEGFDATTAAEPATTLKAPVAPTVVKKESSGSLSERISPAAPATKAHRDANELPDKNNRIVSNDSAVFIKKEESPVRKLTDVFPALAVDLSPTTTESDKEHSGPAKRFVSTIEEYKSAKFVKNPNFIIKVVSPKPVVKPVVYGTKSQSLRGFVSNFEGLENVFDLTDIEEAGAGVLEIKEHPFPIGVMLAIAHCKFHYIKEKPTIGELYYLTKFTAKYECTSILQPWAEVWCNKMIGSSFSDGLPLDKAVCVAWEVGNVEWFRNFTREMVELSKAKNGELVTNIGRPINGSLLPEGLIGERDLSVN
jgi:hypothetical protein